MGRLDGKVAIITGSGRVGNIGVAACEAFLREGARAVIATDFRSEQSDEIVGSVEAQFGAGRFRLLQHDVTSEQGWQDVIGIVQAEYGALDVLVNNAGISVHGGIEATSLDELRRVMAVNHDALFLGMKLCAPMLASAIDRFPGGGSIINTLSMASYMPNAHNVAYHVAKAAGRMLTMCAAQEFGNRRIRVNSVHPGLTVTPLLKEGFAQYAEQGLWESGEAAEDAIAAMGPLGTKGYPEDTAHAFVYLASDESRFVTGATIVHDGGKGGRY